MNPCGPQMPDGAWRRFLGAHPHWHAPLTAPCRGVRAWLRTAARFAKVGTAIAGAGAAAAGIGIGVGRLIGFGWSPVDAPWWSPSAWVGPGPAAWYQPDHWSPSAPAVWVHTGAPVAAHPFVSVPEPSSLLVFAGAVLLLIVVRRAERNR